uniref:Pinin n=1 Tax=Timema shepardi TaxID=629360 RepID=A0A7R9B0E1_TIMSH|nr:unnamed protein product [Timema shepardi]
MTTEIMKSFGALQAELEQAKNNLKGVDEHIKKLIGRDPSEGQQRPGLKRTLPPSEDFGRGRGSDDFGRGRGRGFTPLRGRRDPGGRPEEDGGAESSAKRKPGDLRTVFSRLSGPPKPRKDGESGDEDEELPNKLLSRPSSSDGRELERMFKDLPAFRDLQCDFQLGHKELCTLISEQTDSDYVDVVKALIVGNHTGKTCQYIVQEHNHVVLEMYSEEHTGGEGEHGSCFDPMEHLVQALKVLVLELGGSTFFYMSLRASIRITGDPAISSRVIATPRELPSRQEVMAAQSKDERNKARNKRMFGALLGTLQKFRQEETRMKDKEEKRAIVEKKLEENAKREKEELKKERQELFQERKRKQAEIKKIEFKMLRIKEQEEWESKHRHLLNFIQTRAKPHIFYLPKVQNLKTEERLVASQKVVAKMIEKKRQDLQIELEAIERRGRWRQGVGEMGGGEGREDTELPIEADSEGAVGDKENNRLQSVGSIVQSASVRSDEVSGSGKKAAVSRDQVGGRDRKVEVKKEGSEHKEKEVEVERKTGEEEKNKEKKGTSLAKHDT